MPKKKHHSNDSARNLTSSFPPMPSCSALADTPSQEKAEGNEVHEEHFASGHHLGCDGVGANPRGSVEVDVEEEDDDGEEEGYEDRHPTQDVQEGPHHGTQSANQDQTRVDCQSMEEIFDELENLSRCLMVWGSSRQRADPVLVYVQMVPGKHLIRLERLIPAER